MTDEELREVLAENKRLEKLVYVPGLWRCPKCQFQLTQANLNAQNGTVTATDKPGDKCPNCHGPLWRVTERDAGNRLIDDLERLALENAELRRVAAQVQEQIAQWMITHSYATGHGDTIEDLLSELIGQVRAETVEESAKVADRHTDPLFSDAYRIAADDIAKRIRGLLNKDGAT